MNSFDVFDTLIGRRHITADRVWKTLGEEFYIAEFPERRRRADTGVLSLEGIYRKLVADGALSSDNWRTIMDREIELETESVFPIQDNLDRVKDGDLMISDMYLPGHVILNLLRAASLTRQVTIHQSNGDKRTGRIWDLLIASKPTLHFGDNQESDFRIPRSRGINAELYNGTGLTNIENVLKGRGLEALALMLREFRLRQRSGRWSSYFELALQLNLPFLYVVCEQVFRLLHGRNIVFLGRDCQLLQRLYTAYYEPCTYLPFSRLVAYASPEDACNYLKFMSPQEPVYVDISSTGGTWSFLESFGKHEMLAVVHGDTNQQTLPKSLPPGFSCLTKNSICGETNLVLEIANCADHGFLKSVKRLGEGVYASEYGESEIPADLVQILHEPVSAATHFTKHYRSDIRVELSALSGGGMREVFHSLMGAICEQKWAMNQIPGFQEKELKYYVEVMKSRTTKPPKI